ncbi:hypothetical protein CY35_01G147600 [Sphagnum magellanicum]|nr:hypothetical protein CY35_01G147600 [Sphagnum magellanicum]KAH9576160.1 hypothetical protein CY35_01G147600 [Sphagnum magellanicum]
MEIADLATSAGINLALAVLFFVLYSVFRKQPGNAGVYFTRHMLREKEKEVKKQPFSFEALVPSAGWVKKSWDPTEDDILHSSGLDAVVFLRIFIFGLRFFSICVLVGFGVLTPLNFTDNYLSRNPDEKYGTLEKITILNISFGSKRLWVHFGVLYFISISAYVLLYVEYKHITNMRQEYLSSVTPQPDQFSVLVRSVPPPESEDQSYSDNVDYFFRRFHPLAYLSHQMVYRSSLIQSLRKEMDSLKLKILSLKQKAASQRRPCRAGFCGLYGPLVDPVELHTQKMEDVYHQIRELQTSFRNKQSEVPTAFVTFKTRWEAATTAQTQQSSNPMIWATEWAPEPRDVDWSNLEIPYSQLFFRLILAGVLAALITIFYIPLTGSAVALANLNSLKRYLPNVIVDALLKIPGLKSVIQGYLPALVLSAILYFVPYIMLYLSQLEGYASVSHQERKAAGKFFNLLAGNVFLVTVLGGSLVSIIETFADEPKLIPRRLAEAIPSQAEFFITYVLTSWTGFPLEILQTGSLVFNFLKRHTVERKQQPLLDTVQSLPYYRTIPSILFFILLGLVYSIVNPLLLPFLLIYFILGYIVFRNQVLFVYEPAYETGGQFWPEVHTRIISCLIFTQVLFIGLFSLKGSGRASLACIPLPILTLLFHAHCRQRFQPTFKNFNLESTMKKDMEDEASGRKEQVLNEIQTAYLHPALHDVTLDVEHNSNTERLLPASSAFDDTPPV